jgi:hypothetical protein
MDPRLETGGWITLKRIPLGIFPDRDFHPARYTELSSAR